MKKFLLLFIFSLITFTSSAEIISFKTTSYTYKTKGLYGWSDWYPVQSSNMLLTINTDTDIIIINSPKRQIYKIYDYENAYVDNDGDAVLIFYFIDQDRDYGQMRLIQRRSGKSEIYIDFNNIIWTYTVIRL